MQLLVVPRRRAFQRSDLSITDHAQSPIRSRREVDILTIRGETMDKTAAKRFLLTSKDLAFLCQQNAEISRELRQHDRAAAFTIMCKIFLPGTSRELRAASWPADSFARKITEKLYVKEPLVWGFAHSSIQHVILWGEEGLTNACYDCMHSAPSLYPPDPCWFAACNCLLSFFCWNFLLDEGIDNEASRTPLAPNLYEKSEYFPSEDANMRHSTSLNSQVPSPVISRDSWVGGLLSAIRHPRTSYSLASNKGAAQDTTPFQTSSTVLSNTADNKLSRTISMRSMFTPSLPESRPSTVITSGTLFSSVGHRRRFDENITKIPGWTSTNSRIPVLQYDDLDSVAVKK